MVTSKKFVLYTPNVLDILLVGNAQEPKLSHNLICGDGHFERLIADWSGQERTGTKDPREQKTGTEEGGREQESGRESGLARAEDGHGGERTEQTTERTQERADRANRRADGNRRADERADLREQKTGTEESGPSRRRSGPRRERTEQTGGDTRERTRH